MRRYVNRFFNWSSKKELKTLEIRLLQIISIFMSDFSTVSVVADTVCLSRLADLTTKKRRW
jgi:hypothetical protein